MRRQLTKQLVLRSPMKPLAFTTFKLIKYPNSKVYRQLKQPLPTMAKAFLKIIWKSATIEEYKPGQLINNGKAQSDTDLLYVLEGSIVYRLEKTDVTTLSRALFVEFSKSEYVDMKTLSSKRIKTLANMDFNRGLGADKRMILEEESSLCISEITESENSQPV